MSVWFKIHCQTWENILKIFTKVSFSNVSTKQSSSEHIFYDKLERKPNKQINMCNI